MNAMENPRTEDSRDIHARGVDALLHISNAVGSVMEPAEVLNVIVREAAYVMNADVCSIFLLDNGSPQLRLRATYGLNQEIVNKAVIPVGRGIAGWVAQTGQIVAVPDARADERFYPIPGSGEEKVRAFLCAPLRIQDERIGVMTARMSRTHDFSPSEIQLFETICKQTAIVIEKARLYEEKMQAERLAAIALGLSEIAHYIKNLLQSVEGGSFVIEKGLEAGDLERIAKGWDLLRRNNRKITELVQNMLAYSRDDNEPSFEPGPLNELLREVVDSAQAGIERPRVQLVESYEPNLPDIDFDHDFLFDSFLNLVLNAIDSLPEEGGVVVVGSRRSRDPELVVVEVIDTGKGIPPEYQDKIFNLFFSTKGARGSGIGLAATRKKILAHGGTIEFDTEPGKGTTFRVRLPIHPKSSIMSRARG